MTDQDYAHGRSTGTEAAIQKLNTAATALTDALDAFERVARAKAV